MTTNEITDKLWDDTATGVRAQIEADFDTVGHAAFWMACTNANDVRTPEDELMDEFELGEPEEDEDDDPRADLEGYYYAIHDGWVTT